MQSRGEGMEVYIVYYASPMVVLGDQAVQSYDIVTAALLLTLTTLTYCKTEELLLDHRNQNYNKTRLQIEEGVYR